MPDSLTVNGFTKNLQLSKTSSHLETASPFCGLMIPERSIGPRNPLGWIESRLWIVPDLIAVVGHEAFDPQHFTTMQGIWQTFVCTAATSSRGRAYCFYVLQEWGCCYQFSSSLGRRRNHWRDTGLFVRDLRCIRLLNKTACLLFPGGEISFGRH